VTSASSASAVAAHKTSETPIDILPNLDTIVFKFWRFFGLSGGEGYERTSVRRVGEEDTFYRRGLVLIDKFSVSDAKWRALFCIGSLHFSDIWSRFGKRCHAFNGSESVKCHPTVQQSG
jgi:hypothetical protein